MKLFARWRSLTSVHPPSFHRRVPSDLTTTRYVSALLWGETAIIRNTYGVSGLLVPLLEDDDSKSCICQKTRSSHIQRTNQKLPTKQRAPHSLKRTGAETTCGTTGIGHQSLPWLCFNAPPPEGGSKLVVYPPGTAVVRGVLN